MLFEVGFQMDTSFTVASLILVAVRRNCKVLSQVTTQAPQGPWCTTVQAVQYVPAWEQASRLAWPNTHYTSENRDKTHQLVSGDSANVTYLKFNSNTEPPLSLQTANVGSSVNWKKISCQEATWIQIAAQAWNQAKHWWRYWDDEIAACYLGILSCHVIHFMHDITAYIFNLMNLPGLTKSSLPWAWRVAYTLQDLSLQNIGICHWLQNLLTERSSVVMNLNRPT